MVRIASGAAPGPVATAVCDYAQSKDLKRVDSTTICKNVLSAPEIDPASAIAGLTLLLGGIAVIRGRRVKASAR